MTCLPYQSSLILESFLPQGMGIFDLLYSLLLVEGCTDQALLQRFRGCVQFSQDHCRWHRSTRTGAEVNDHIFINAVTKFVGILHENVRHVAGSG